ncbi:response regulator transcription factor [Deefgea tanakiae]|uniref:Response regulator transcription factor n=1 Tax=Deefgea tanakiae TaxID=2865840 RepID=A0ABX8Z3M5_9NEIS|nr:response regulator transcription factor [Deefgea tanakiae]QZA76975.1 response regulator transcription factor [Deefgea tanakiae]
MSSEVAIANMAAQHCVISNSSEFQFRWTTLLAVQGPVLSYQDGNELIRLMTEPPLSCVLDMRAFSAQLMPHALMGLAKVTPLLLEFERLTVDEELAWLAVGVRACCTPDLSLERLAVIVDVTHRGGIWVSNAALPFLLKGLQHYTAHHSAMAASPNLTQLTPQERKIADLVGRGDSNKLIARELNISDRTVKTHLGAIFSKLQVADRIHLALLLNQQK